MLNYSLSAYNSGYRRLINKKKKIIKMMLAINYTHILMPILLLNFVQEFFIFIKEFLSLFFQGLIDQNFVFLNIFVKNFIYYKI